MTAQTLTDAAPALLAISDDDILTTWNDTLAAFLDAGSPERRALDPDLLAATGLSTEGLQRGLESIGAGMLGEPAAAELRRSLRQHEDGFSLVVLPANPPGLILQSLLPALAARAPVLFKSSRAEPFFAPAFLAALGRRRPVLREAYTAATWTGGDAEIEDALRASARLVVAYGSEPTMTALAAADTRRLVTFGPKLSIGWVGADADLEQAVPGMALDIALFDQRGCLSVEAVLVEQPAADPFAHALADALAELTTELPPGRASDAERAGVRLAREEADLRGLAWFGDALDAGTVIVENDSRLRPSPGLRTVRIHSVPALPPLDDWNGRIQGLAIAGHMPATVRRPFERAGVSRFAPAGQLQATDAAWRNGGIDLAAEFADPSWVRSNGPISKLKRGLNRMHERYTGAFRRLAD